MPNMTPTRPDVRGKAFDVIDGERDYQDMNHPTSPDHAIEHTTNLLIEYTDKLAVEVVKGSTKALDRLRQIAALAVKGMEIHGVAPRENHVPASAGITGVVNIKGKSDALAPKK